MAAPRYFRGRRPGLATRGRSRRRAMEERAAVRGYRLVILNGLQTQPKLWEWEQPYIGTLIDNARRFDHQVNQRFFTDHEDLVVENSRIWEAHYRPVPLFDHTQTWQEWLAEYRELMVEILEINGETPA